jgi:uncharacterized protein with GYD domain
VPKYAVLFNFRGGTLKAIMDKPGDRAAVVRELAESAGGTMEAYYLEYDGLVIHDVRDSASAAAISLKVRSSDAFSHFETHKILPADQINPILEKASELRYRPPGT